MPLTFSLGDAASVGMPGAAVAFMPWPRPGLGAADEIPRCQVVVGDDLVTVGRVERLPARAGWRGEPRHCVVEVADEACDAAELDAEQVRALFRLPASLREQAFWWLLYDSGAPAAALRRPRPASRGASRPGSSCPAA